MHMKYLSIFCFRNKKLLQKKSKIPQTPGLRSLAKQYSYFKPKKALFFIFFFIIIKMQIHIVHVNKYSYIKDCDIHNQ